MRLFILPILLLLVSCTTPPPITLYQYNQIPSNLIEEVIIPIPPNIDEYLELSTEKRLSTMHDYSRNLLRVLHEVRIKINSLRKWDEEQLEVWENAKE